MESLRIENLGNIAQLSEKVSALRQTRSRVLGRDLHQALVEPMYQDEKQPSQLYVVPDGSLTMLPFDLLRDASGAYLIENTEVSYLSSGRDVTYNGSKSSTINPNSTAVAFANPDFGDTDWAPLDNTSAEVQTLKRFFSNTSLYQQSEATLEHIREMRSPTILHLATHGYVEKDDPSIAVDDNPMVRSGLVFSSEASGVVNLRASEVIGLDLQNTELVVLSACESGLGVAANGEGVYGLRRAFTLAGADAQVVSLWPVSDEGTQVFMESFYGYLSSGKPKAEALRQSKLDMKNSVRWSAPVFWGAFILVGQ